MASASTRALLTVAAAVEFGAGVGLLLAPALTAELLIGLPLGTEGGPVVARIAGTALAVLGLICWLESRSARPGAPLALLAGLLAYNAAAPLPLIAAFLTNHADGIGLWPAVVLHVALALWSAACIRSSRPQPLG